MGNHALRNADLTLGGNPLYLRDKAPAIHQEYVSDDEIYASYSISPEFSRLMSSSTFTRAVEGKIGAFTVVEIQVDLNREVQVRLPGEDRFEVVTVSDPKDNAEITRILRKSQEAYNRYRDSLPPSPVTSPSLSPGRVYPTSPTQVPDLSSQIADLRHELRSVKMQRDLDNKRHQIQALTRQVRDLQSERADAHAILSEARELFEEEKAPDLVEAIKGLQRQVRDKRVENLDLRTPLENLRRDKQTKVRELQDQLDKANGLFPSSDTRPLLTKIFALMEEADRLPPLEQNVDDQQALQQLRHKEGELALSLERETQAKAKLQETLDHVKAQLKKPDANIGELAGDVAELQRALQLRVKSLVSGYNALRSENIVNKAAIEELRSQLVVETSGKQKAESALEVAQENNSALGSQLESQRLQFEQALQQGLRPLQGQVKQLCEALEGVKGSLQSGSSENLPGQVATLKQAYDQLVATDGKTLVAKEGLQRSLDQQVREYGQLASQKRASDQKIFKLTNELKASRSSNSTLQDTLRAIQSDLKAKVNLDDPAEPRSLFEHCKTLSAADSKDQETLQQLTREAQAKDELHEALDQIKAQLESPDANIRQIAEHVGELQAAKGRAEKRAKQLETEIEDVRRTASASVEQIRKLKANDEEENIRMNLELLRLRDILGRLQEGLGYSLSLDIQMWKVPEFEHLPSLLQESLEAAQEKFSQAQADVQRYEQKISDLNERHAQELAQIKGSVVKAREELDEAYQRDREALEAQVLEASTQFDSRLKNLRQTIQVVREELQVMTDSKDAYRKDNVLLERNVEKLEAIINRQKREAQKTQSEVENRDLIIEKERTRTSRIESELKSLKSKMNHLATERVDLEDNLLESSEMTVHYKEKSEQLRVRNLKLSSTINGLEEELATADARIKELETENDRIHRIMAGLLGLKYPLTDTSYSAEDWEQVVAFNKGIIKI